jgi:hypothetical protein
VFTAVLMALEADALAWRKPQPLHQVALARGDGFIPSPGTLYAHLGYGFHCELFDKTYLI